MCYSITFNHVQFPTTIASIYDIVNFDPEGEYVYILYLMFILYIWNCVLRLGLQNEMQDVIYCLNMSQSEAN